MKLYISADMEGVTGIVSWTEVQLNNPEYENARLQMTKEVSAVIEGFNEMESNAVLLKDAHDSGRNILADRLPKGTKMHRSWSKDIFVMMSGLDSTFDACIFTGYHDAAYGNGNPLAHTMSEHKYSYIKLNGEIVSEMMLNAYTAAYMGVPVIMITGDDAICKRAKSMMPNIFTLPVKTGIGGACTSLHPEDSIELLKSVALDAAKAFAKNPDLFKLDLPNSFELTICFQKHVDAYRASFYPGVSQIDEHTVQFKCDDYYALLQMFYFAA